jgi:hypothetical protein
LSPAPADGTVLSGLLPASQQTVQVFNPGFTTILYAGPAPDQVAAMMQVSFRSPDVVDNPPTILLYAGPWSAELFSVWVRASSHHGPLR